MGLRPRWGIVILAIAPAYYVLTFVLPRSLADPVRAWMSFDLYGYFYPNMLHAAASLHDGTGWAWNPFQNCGQPFMALSATGLFYPLHWLFLVLPREPALLTSQLVHLVLAGLGAWLLARAHGVGWVAGAAAALAFQLGGWTLSLGAWSPIHLAPFVWLPWALWATERLLRTPTLERMAVLACVLALQLLPGYPQAAFFTYQLVLLRVAYAWLSLERRPAAATALAFGGMLAGALLVAMQYLPALEVSGESVRAGGLRLQDVSPASRNLEPIRSLLLVRTALVAPLMLAAVAALSRATWRSAVFYLAVVTLYCVLRLGPGTPLFDLYVALPGGDLFRNPDRFLWVVGFALSMLAGLGVESLVRAGVGKSRFVPVALMPLAMLAVAALAPGFLDLHRLTLASVTLGIALVAVARPAWTPRVAWLLVLAIAASSLPFGAHVRFAQKSGEMYVEDPDVIRRVQGRSTPQDRVHFADGSPFSRTGRFGPIQKLGSIHRLRAVGDYEPQVSRRFAEYFLYAETGRRHVTGSYDGRTRTVVPRHPNLLNLTAARYVILPSGSDARKAVERQGWQPLHVGPRFRSFENPRALPRARFVPRVRVVPEHRVLPLLARPFRDPARVSLVERAPSSGFLGVTGTEGSVDFLENGSTRVVLDVRADGPGFVHLADQHFPGWQAEVDGAPAEILRADYVFRLVEVPAGRSTVVFSYRPWSRPVGALVSLCAAITLAGVVWRSRRGRSLLMGSAS